MTQPSASAARRVFWVSASLVVGVFMLFVARGKGLFQNPETRVFEASVFFGSWLAIVLLMRAFSKRFRGVEDMTIENLFKRGDDDSPKR